MEYLAPVSRAPDGDGRSRAEDWMLQLGRGSGYPVNSSGQTILETEYHNQVRSEAQKYGEKIK
jgi:hypothetical protein